MSARLAPATVAFRAVSEADLLAQVTELATLLGWNWVHFRPAQTQRGWRTPVQGPLGKGWPDLVLLRTRDRRLVFVELKREMEQPTGDQAAVLAALGELKGLVVYGDDLRGRIEVHVWHPSMLDEITAVLR